jgi:hypothetical protein
MSGWQDGLKGLAVSAVYRQEGFGKDAPTFKEPQEACSVPLQTKNSLNTREHWALRSKRARSQRSKLKSEVSKRLPEIGLPLVVITLTRVSPRSMDSDGVVAALKHCRDGVADALRIDDASPLVEWRYAQRKGPASVEFSIERKP